jgi:hypothetical protein
MTRSTRRIIFFIFILIFLIVTPGVLLYATGYSFDWENKQIIKTGSFYFQSLPDSAKILIDGKEIDKTPSYIARQNPGTYGIQISKEGFTSWQKKLNIQAQLTTEARNIMLIPQKPLVIAVAQNVTSTEEYFLTQPQKDTDLEAAKTASSSPNIISSYTVFGNNIYYLQKSNLILYRTDLSGGSRDQLSLESLPSPNKKYDIVVSAEQTAVYEPGGKLYLFDKQTRIFNLIAEQVRGVEFSSDNEKILYWTDHEIWVVWFKDVWAQPYRKAGEKELITRYSDKIIQAIWLARTNEHIIFAVADGAGQAQIKITELDNRDTRNTFDIYTAPDPEIYWNSDDELLYILSSGKLSSINLTNIQ